MTTPTGWFVVLQSQESGGMKVVGKGRNVELVVENTVGTYRMSDIFTWERL